MENGTRICTVKYSNTGMVSGRSFATKNYTSQIFHTMYSTVYYVRLRTVRYSTSYETKIISHSDNYSEIIMIYTVRYVGILNFLRAYVRSVRLLDVTNF